MKAAIVEIKAFNNPPDKVKLVMDAMCIIMGVKTNWKDAKTILKDPSEFQRHLQNYDFENFDSKIVGKVS